MAGVERKKTLQNLKFGGTYNPHEQTSTILRLCYRNAYRKVWRITNYLY